MNHPLTQSLVSYEENLKVSKQIDAILLDTISNRMKEKKLTELQSSVSASLAKAHISYYIDQIRKKRRDFWSRVLLIPLFMIHLLYIIYRMYYIQHPEIPHYEKFPILGDISAELMVSAFPLCLLGYYLLCYFFLQKTPGRKPLPKFVRILIILFFVMIGGFLSYRIIQDFQRFRYVVVLDDRTYIDYYDKLGPSSKPVTEDMNYWYTDYEYYYSTENNTLLELYVQNDVMLCVSFRDTYNTYCC